MKYFHQFRVAPGSKVKLKDIDPWFKGEQENHKDATEELEQYQKKLRSLQELFYADGRSSLLICLQGMDTGGKDGTINHILGAMNPQGCRVVGFRQPSVEELAHDFLWRIHRAVPPRGQVAIFNRSHYEDVLIVRVHNLVPQAVWSGRYDQINQWIWSIFAGSITRPIRHEHGTNNPSRCRLDEFRHGRRSSGQRRRCKVRSAIATDLLGSTRRSGTADCHRGTVTARRESRSRDRVDSHARSRARHESGRHGRTAASTGRQEHSVADVRCIRQHHRSRS